MPMRRVPRSECKMHCPDAVDEQTIEQSAALLDAVRSGGEAGLLATAVKFADLTQAQADAKEYVLTSAELKPFYDGLPAPERALLDRTAARIRAFADAQRRCLVEMEMPIASGAGRAGHQVAAVECAGCYAPGGRYPLPSSVLMTVITAKAAGVPRVIVASPRPTAVTKAAAWAAGADLLLCVGGAQAIGAMAFGCGKVGKCDVIVGPGNKWVTAAKKLVSGVVGIDMLAGPSEVLVIADATADPGKVAADLLAQAEHDTAARAVLVAVGAGVADAVDAEVQRQLAVLPTRAVAEVAIAEHSFIVEVDTIEQAIAVADTVAPEHLEVMTADADGVARRLSHYGGLFIGTHAAEVLGDYGAGPNHVLPTGGTARFGGGLSVFNFLRVRTWMRVDRPASRGAQELVADAEQLAHIEGLEGHAAAAKARRMDVDEAADAAAAAAVLGNNSKVTGAKGSMGCPVPHTRRDQVWLVVGALIGAAAAFSFGRAKA